VTPGQQAADSAGQAGRKLSTDSASRSRAVTGYEHESVQHTQKEDARGEVHAKRAARLCALLKPYLRVWRGMSKCHLPGSIGFLQCRRTFRQYKAFGRPN
jgi:hypothetical protein